MHWLISFCNIFILYLIEKLNDKIKNSNKNKSTKTFLTQIPCLKYSLKNNLVSTAAEQKNRTQNSLKLIVCFHEKKIRYEKRQKRMNPAIGVDPVTRIIQKSKLTPNKNGTNIINNYNGCRLC